MELVEKIARSLCEQHIRNVRRHDTAPDELESMMQAAVNHAWPDFKDAACAALTALIEHAGGDGVTEGDKRAATELMVGPKVAGGDGQTYVLRTPSYSEASEAFAHHRATAFAAGKAARDREIVEWLRDMERDALLWKSRSVTELADAIERGEV